MRFRLWNVRQLPLKQLVSDNESTVPTIKRKLNRMNREELLVELMSNFALRRKPLGDLSA